MLLFSSLSCGTIFASATYTYTGQPFTLGPNAGQTITATVVLSAPIGPNSFYDSNSSGWPVDWSISVGTASISILTPPPGLLVYLVTGSNGEIINRDMDGSKNTSVTPNTIGLIDTRNLVSTDSYYDTLLTSLNVRDADVGYDSSLNINILDANSNAPGTWTETETATPEPGTLLLLVTGLAGLAGTIRRKLSI